ncbi:MAG: nucleotidyl transferase AbiEii/AbiGii toxin family protein [Prolixibacteraceae bacterium]|nr:nucleotidyl transferase AbiEii/AbiGii toxin family protein [Prolixibacteraceae bacterium]
MTALKFFQLTPAEKSEIIDEIQRGTPLPPTSIEKDWWVVQTMALVFQMEAAPHLVFKGGTSLSKAWGIIERFSEDIDLALSREFLGFSGKISRTQVGKLRDASFKYISETFLPELRESFQKNGFEGVTLELTEVESPDQDPVNILITYPTVVDKSDYVLPQVKLEIGSRSLLEPFTNRQFCSFIGDRFAGRPFADEKITIPCVNPERTYLEKLFLLHEEFKRPAAEIRVDRMSRHIYDIQKISKTEYAGIAMANKELYKSLVDHRKHFMRWGGVDYATHFPPNLNPMLPQQLLAAFESDYKTMQDQMIYGESLPFSKLIEELKAIIDTFNHIDFSENGQ